MPGQMVPPVPTVLADTEAGTKYSIQNSGSRGNGLVYAIASSAVPAANTPGWHIIPFPLTAVMSHEDGQKIYVRCDPGQYGQDLDTFEIAYSEAE